MSDDREHHDQTAESIAGIPTPYDNENMGPTDGLNEFVEGMMDAIRLDFTDKAAPSSRRQDDRP